MEGMMGGSDGLTWSSPIQTVLRDREAGAWPEMEIDPVTATRRRTVQGRDTQNGNVLSFVYTVEGLKIDFSLFFSPPRLFPSPKKYGC